MATNPDEPSDVSEDEMLARSFVKARENAKKSFGRFNLLLVGRSGVGKSSLVNAVFGRKLANVGVGLPVTEGLTYYNEGALGIWDSEGFELGDSRSPMDRIKEDLAKVKNRPRNEQISVVWYCVDSNSKRLLPSEIEVIREIAAAGFPVILVLTKVQWLTNPFKAKNFMTEDLTEFWNWLQDPVDKNGNAIDFPVVDVIPTSVKSSKGKGKEYGLSELVGRTLQESPDDAKDAFRIAQRLNLPWKRQMARIVITVASGSAAVAAAVPIPVADAATLAPIQIAMMGRIAAIYELDLNTMMSAGALGQVATQIAGKALARGFIKLIPGVGSLIGSAVASALTGAGGEAWMHLCEQVYTGELKIDDVEELINDFGPSFKEIIIRLVREAALFDD
jgi:uncharacterized protein (DUF697 family)/GTP-binding protein EngB required for normal cell division